MHTVTKANSVTNTNTTAPAGSSLREETTMSETQTPDPVERPQTTPEAPQTEPEPVEPEREDDQKDDDDNGDQGEQA
jgi:hypothetical protein